MIIFLLWIVLAFIIGGIGSSRKIGWAGAFFAALLLSPIIGMLIVLASERKSDIAYKEKMLRLMQQNPNCNPEVFDNTDELKEFNKNTKFKQFRFKGDESGSIISKYGIYILYIAAAIGVIIYIISTSTGTSDYEEKTTNTEIALSPREDLIYRIKKDAAYTRNEIDAMFLELGMINTFVDGEDVRVVNLWNTTSGDRQINASLRHGTTVCIMGEKDGYLLVGTSRSPIFEWGYCLPDFVRR